MCVKIFLTFTFCIKLNTLFNLPICRKRGIIGLDKMAMSNTKNKEVHIMAYVINDECVSCGACEAECPVGAIAQGADHYEIDADACVDCGACAAQCPVGAIAQG